MKVYIVVEMFLGGKVPEIKGVYKEKTKAEEIQNNYRFAFIDTQNLIQFQTKTMQTEVYVVIELLKFNVPNVVGVFNNKELAEETAIACEYPTHIVTEKLL